MTSSINTQKTKSVITHISNLMSQVDTLRDDISEAIKVQSEELNIDKKTLRKLCTIHNKQTLNKVKDEYNDVIDTYEAIMK